MAQAERSDVELVAAFDEVLDRLVAVTPRPPRNEPPAPLNEDDLLADFGALLGRLVERAEAKVKDYADLRRKLPPRDPLLLQTDLLGALGSEQDEVLHTQAIATLLGAPFGPRLLGALLAQELSFRPDKVNAEHAIRVGEHDRCLDLLVCAGSRIIIIENKIKAEDSEGQLDD
ncbi:MAG: PD-(D/E)XK nuclease family protein, partial [Polyangiaceae bacterium]